MEMELEMDSIGQCIKTMVENKPEYREYTYALYQDNDLIGFLEGRELLKSYGHFHYANAREREKCIEIDLLPPNTMWFDRPNEIENIGFTDTSSILTDPGEIDGFYTFCVGNSFEAGFIYVDVAFTMNIYRDEEPQVMVLNTKGGFEGRGYRDVPIKVPHQIIDMVLAMAKNSKSDFYE